MTNPERKPGVPSSALRASVPATKTLKKGQLLFAEGEDSHNMYLIRKGIIRIFKKKGDSQIELATLHADQIVGELAFLDGDVRSASAEALTDCDLTEVSISVFTATVSSIPEWLKTLIKTIVGRLRGASTRIRQLETASMAVDYAAAKDGKGGGAVYIYLSVPDVLKISSAIVLVAARSNSVVKLTTLEKYANQVMGVPTSKIASMVDIYTSLGLMGADTGTEGSVRVLDLDFLETAISYMAEENLKEASKRRDITNKGFLVMNCIQKHMKQFTKNPETGEVVANLAEILKLEIHPETGKPIFRPEDTEELVRLSYVGQLEMKSGTEILVRFKEDAFLKSFKLQRIVKMIEATNQIKKQKSSK